MIGSLSYSPESVAHPVPIDLPFRPDKNSDTSRTEDLLKKA
jgi:hypothetical protein